MKKKKSLKTRISVCKQNFFYRRQRLSLSLFSSCSTVMLYFASEKENFQLKSISNCLAATKTQTVQQIFAKMFLSEGKKAF